MSWNVTRLSISIASEEESFSYEEHHGYHGQPFWVFFLDCILASTQRSSQDLVTYSASTQAMLATKYSHQLARVLQLQRFFFKPKCFNGSESYPQAGVRIWSHVSRILGRNLFSPPRLDHPAPEVDTKFQKPHSSTPHPPRRKRCGG